MESIKSAQNILVVFDKSDYLSSFVDDLKQKTSGEINTKSTLELSSEGSAKYDFIVSGFANHHGLKHDDNLLSTYLKILKPNGQIVLRDISQNEISSKLILTGFTKIAETGKSEISNDEKQKLNIEGDVKIVEISCAKPNFEVGSSTKLSFANKKTDATAVWKIDSNDGDEEIDPDSLLDEDDLKKPDPSSLRVCGTTGKRKACKDCSCGLAEELASEANGSVAPAADAAPKSSCGSCYLGDAFRCATCPYLGMPAFKPGEKIQLAGNQLQADI